MNLPIGIHQYEQAKSNVTLPGEVMWSKKWDVYITCDSYEAAKKLKEALLAIDVDVLMWSAEK